MLRFGTAPEIIVIIQFLVFSYCTQSQTKRTKMRFKKTDYHRPKKKCKNRKNTHTLSVFRLQTLDQSQKYFKKLTKIYEKIKPEEAKIAVEKKGAENCFPVFISEKSVQIPPHSRRNIKFTVNTKDDDKYYYSVEGATNALSMTCSNCVSRKCGILEVSNFTAVTKRIDSNTKIGNARRIEWRQLPLLEGIYDEEVYKCEATIDTPQVPGVKGLPSQESALHFQNVLQNIRNRKMDKLADILSPFESTFVLEDPGDPLTFMRTPPATLPVKSTCPDSLPLPYRRQYTKSEMEFIDKFVEQNLISGAISKSNSPYTAPILLVKKPGSTLDNPIYRLTCDVRKINKACLEPVAFPMPDLATPIKDLGYNKFFTSLDVQNAFTRQRLSEESKKFCSFVVFSGKSVGTYSFNGCMQGILSSPAMFQTTMNHILSGLIGESTYIYIDDLICASPTYAQHLIDIQKVMSRLKEFDVRLDIRKCKFAETAVSYLGLILSNGTVRTDPTRTAALDNLAIPKLSLKCEKPWLSFFGTLSYFRKFIKSYANYESEIKNLRNECRENPTDETLLSKNLTRIAAILKHLVHCIKTVLLVVVPPGSDIVISTDASGYGIGFSVLTKEGRPICFGSKKLSETQMRWTTFERELYGCYYALLKAAPYCCSAKSVILYSDNLSGILNLGNTTTADLSTRAIKFIQQIQTKASGTNIRFQHIAGLRNNIADLCSRNPYETRTDSIKVNLLTRQTSKNVEKITLLHNQTHFGIGKLFLLCKEQGLNAPNLRSLCAEVISGCSICTAERRLLASTAIGETPTPFRELTDWSIDHVHLTRSRSSNRYIIAAVDRFSKYLICQAVESMSMNHCASFLRFIFTVFPDASAVYADNAFDNAPCKSVCDENEVTIDYSASHNSRSNNVERQNGTIRALLERYIVAQKSHPDDWDLQLPRICQAYNQTPHTTTKVSPYRLVFNRIPTLLAEKHSDIEITELRDQVRSRLLTAKSKYVTKAPEDIKLLPPGTEIYIRYSSKSPKIHAKILQDYGFTARVQKTATGHRYSVIRVAKRHIFEIIKVNQTSILRFSLNSVENVDSM